MAEASERRRGPRRRRRRRRVDVELVVGQQRPVAQFVADQHVLDAADIRRRQRRPVGRRLGAAAPPDRPPRRRRLLVVVVVSAADVAGRLHFVERVVPADTKKAMTFMQICCIDCIYAVLLIIWYCV